ncbi:hypothetical protein Q31b_50440 [Novipirellula aureliae]|uniref:Uncharacterized protein n=1 Tax=Novipirellula aureliae TaxID=2527966 RepID=A0A5C6DL38_9BACT|nr:hypothetical protein [Novipirellula aureliae]TWU35609.1 hypothetical protein Q31b_50440 [Novipirellula aureliae]
MAPFQNTLVLLDGRTGQTWLLTKHEGESATWVLISVAVPGKVKLESPSSTIGDTQIQFIPEMRGPIIGRSKNNDAATTDSLRGNANGAYRSYDGQTIPSEERRTNR